MSLAYGNFDELTHQLRFLLFEAGIGLSQKAVEHYVTSAHHNCLQRLRQAVRVEQLSLYPLLSHHVSDFIELLQQSMKHTHADSVFYQWQTLKHEIEESIANDALAQAFRHEWQKELRKLAQHHATLWQWLHTLPSAQAMMEFLEQWGCIGHPYHPNFRSKTGFSRREVMQYSPEFNAQVSLHWAAIPRHYTHSTFGTTSYQDLLIQQFPLEYQRFNDSLRFKQYNPADFYPLPVHPWQWRNKIISLFAPLIDKQELLLVAHHHNTRPSMSFRTMMPATQGSCHLKLATAVHTTSSLRLVSEASVDNGPALSTWIGSLLAQHEHYRHSLYVVPDLAGITIRHPAIARHHSNQLALIVRENPLANLTAPQRLVPLAALFAWSPLTQKPLLIEIIERSGITPEHYFSTYCSLVLSGQLHLMLNYGIALECHQQNTLISFNEDQPSSLIIRDLGGIKICTHPLYDAVSKPALHPDSTIISNSLQEVGAKFIHGNLQSNLACWITCLATHYSLLPQSLWHIVYRQLQQLLSDLATCITPAILAQYRHQLLHHAWQHKSLLTMRLNQGQQEDLFTPIANPLSAFL